MMFTRVLLTLLSSCVAVFAGRWLMSFWTGTAKIHELYTAACGLYVCWLSIRAVTVLLAWMPQGRRVILLKVQEWTLMVKNITVVGEHLSCITGRNWSACTSKIYRGRANVNTSRVCIPLSFSTFCEAWLFCMGESKAVVTSHENKTCWVWKSVSLEWKRYSEKGFASGSG